jgi:hypothetical protein
MYIVHTVVSIKCMLWKVCRSPTLTIALSGNNYSLQIIETGFAKQFYASHRVGPASICLKIHEYSLKQDLSNDTTDNPPLFSLVNTFKVQQNRQELVCALISGGIHAAYTWVSAASDPWEYSFLAITHYSYTIMCRLFCVSVQVQVRYRTGQSLWHGSLWTIQFCLKVIDSRGCNPYLSNASGFKTHWKLPKSLLKFRLWHGGFYSFPYTANEKRSLEKIEEGFSVRIFIIRSSEKKLIFISQQ